MLHDRDLVNSLPVRFKQRESVLDGKDEAAAVAQAGRPDRLAQVEDVVAASHRVERVHPLMGDVQPYQPLLLLVPYRPSRSVAWPSMTTSGCMLGGTLTPLALPRAHKTPKRP